MVSIESFVQAGSQDNPSSPAVSSAAVLGNIFIFILAGHETSANTLTYAIILLACHPEVQRALQANLDDILGDRPANEWAFEVDFPKILDGYVGAVMNETLRLYSVLPFIPKKTESVPRTLKLEDRSYTVPASTLIMVNTSATHRNPKHWPAAVRSGSAEGPPYPVSSFNPAHWLQYNHSKREGTTLFSPKPGSFVPFAEGPRACMGKRFAQAQFCAVIASIFTSYSVELAVDGCSQGMDESTRRSLWGSARRKADIELSTGVGFLTSLKMKGKVPLRLVKRGAKQFRF